MTRTRNRTTGVRPDIYTVGYEGRSLEEFLADIRSSGVQILVDVRDAPISRKPGFSKGALSAALAREEVPYRHMRPLGCPKPIRDRYREDHNWGAYTIAFSRHLAAQDDALGELADVARKVRTALLCYEADFRRCHRTFVARAVASSLHVSVRHITPNGEVADGG